MTSRTRARRSRFTHRFGPTCASRRRASIADKPSSPDGISLALACTAVSGTRGLLSLNLARATGPRTRNAHVEVRSGDYSNPQTGGNVPRTPNPIRIRVTGPCHCSRAPVVTAGSPASCSSGEAGPLRAAHAVGAPLLRHGPSCRPASDDPHVSRFPCVKPEDDSAKDARVKPHSLRGPARGATLLAVEECT